MVSFSVKLLSGPKGLKQYTDLYHRDMDTRFGLVYDIIPGLEGNESLALVLLNGSSVRMPDALAVGAE